MELLLCSMLLVDLHHQILCLTLAHGKLAVFIFFFFFFHDHRPSFQVICGGAAQKPTTVTCLEDNMPL